MVARSNYEVQFLPEQQLSERIIFPATPSQRNGIEDARFVCFDNEDGTHTYYATFTAYDGKLVVPELVEQDLDAGIDFVGPDRDDLLRAGAAEVLELDHGGDLGRQVVQVAVVLSR